MKPDFLVTVLKPGEKVEAKARMIQLKPTQLFVLPEGSMENKMSWAFFLSAGEDDVVVAQITTKMMIDAMPDQLLRDLKNQLTDELVKRVRAKHNGVIQ